MNNTNNNHSQLSPVWNDHHIMYFATLVARTWKEYSKILMHEWNNVMRTHLPIYNIEKMIKKRQLTLNCNFDENNFSRYITSTIFIYVLTINPFDGSSLSSLLLLFAFFFLDLYMRTKCTIRGTVLLCWFQCVKLWNMFHNMQGSFYFPMQPIKLECKI